MNGRPGARTANTTRLAPSRASRASIAAAVVSSPCEMSNAAAAAAHRPSKLKSGRSFTIRWVGNTSRPGSSARARNIIAKSDAAAPAATSSGRISGASPSIVS